MKPCSSSRRWRRWHCGRRQAGRLGQLQVRGASVAPAGRPRIARSMRSRSGVVHGRLLRSVAAARNLISPFKGSPGNVTQGNSRGITPKVLLLGAYSNALPTRRHATPSPDPRRRPQDYSMQHSFLRPRLAALVPRRSPPSPRPAFAADDKSVARHRDRRTPGARRRPRRRQGRAEGRRLRSRQEPEVRVPERAGQHRHRSADRAQVRRRPARRDRRHRHAVGAGGRRRDQGHPGRLQRGHRPGRGQAGQDLGRLGHQRHRRVRPVAARPSTSS